MDEDDSPRREREGGGTFIRFPHQSGRVGSEDELAQILLKEISNAEAGETVKLTERQYELLSSDQVSSLELRRLKGRYKVVKDNL